MMENITLALRWTGLSITEGVTTEITARMCARDGLGAERRNVEETDGGTEDRRHEGTSILFLLNLVILSGLDTIFLSCYNSVIITIGLEFIIMKAIILKSSSPSCLWSIS